MNTHANHDDEPPARLLLYRGSMQKEWLAYASDTKRIATAFAAGINAYIDLVMQRPELLPPEFEALGYRPSPWTPEAVARIRSHGLLRNARSEVARGIFLGRFGEAALALRDHLEPEHALVVPEGLDPSGVREEWLTAYLDGTRAVRFPATGPDEHAALDESPNAWSSVVRGSNNWAIAPGADVDRATHSRQRPASRARRPLAALHRASRCSGAVRYRRR